MDELIQILVQMLIELFRGKQPPVGPGGPNLPPRPPAAPPPVPATRIPLPPPELGKPPVRRTVPPRPRQPVRVSPVKQKPAAPVARPPVAPVQTAAASQAAFTPPPPTTVKRPTPAVDAAVIRRWLRPGTLRTQYVLTEIFQPPVALRDSTTRHL